MGFIKKIFGIEKEPDYGEIELKNGKLLTYHGKKIDYSVIKEKSGYFIYRKGKRIKNAVCFDTEKSAMLCAALLHQKVNGVIFDE